MPTSCVVFPKWKGLGILDSFKFLLMSSFSAFFTHTTTYYLSTLSTSCWVLPSVQVWSVHMHITVKGFKITTLHPRKKKGKKIKKTYLILLYMKIIRCCVFPILWMKKERKSPLQMICLFVCLDFFSNFFSLPNVNHKIQWVDLYTQKLCCFCHKLHKILLEFFYLKKKINVTNHLKLNISFIMCPRT